MPKRPLLIALAVLLLDRITKWAIAQTIPLEDAINIIPGLFRLTHLENTGAAFSLFADSPSPFRTALLIAFSVAALVVISFLLWRDRSVFHSGTLALSLILGGAVGNLWDRVSDGKVTDFLDFYIGVHHWPPFNVADSAIVVGALLLFMRMLRKDHHSQAAG
ncbi:MAG: signal peptidase II [Acidobacteriia bacterium]|nr:signal peptidase II [Terriglobia bacterium]